MRFNCSRSKTIALITILSKVSNCPWQINNFFFSPRQWVVAVTVEYSPALNRVITLFVISCNVEPLENEKITRTAEFRRQASKFVQANKTNPGNNSNIGRASLSHEFERRRTYRKMAIPMGCDETDADHRTYRQTDDELFGIQIEKPHLESDNWVAIFVQRVPLLCHDALGLYTFFLQI